MASELFKRLGEGQDRLLHSQSITESKLEELSGLILEIKTLSVDKIIALEKRVLQLENLIKGEKQIPPSCPKCGKKYKPIQRTEKELWPESEETSVLYTLCPHCDHVYHKN